MAPAFIPAEIIKKKRDGLSLTEEEIQTLIMRYTHNQIPDYQMAAWLMAVFFRGMTATELAAFTKAMWHSGKTLSFSSLKAPRVDKHSTGGVGDKTSILIGPIMAAAEVHVPMIAGRGLGHTGGTLDKLQSIPGFRIHLSHEEFQKLVKEHYFSIMGQTEDICPADKKLYALRDVTATVDSLPLICGSIMSKKLAEDLSHLVLDVKFGSGAFMKTPQQALELAKLLIETGEQNGTHVAALLTSMEQPLGRFAGNALEIQECLDILENQTKVINGHDFYASTKELSLHLSAEMLYRIQRAPSRKEALQLATELLVSGKARECFYKLCQYQGPAHPEDLPQAKYKKAFSLPESGYIKDLQTEWIGWATVALGAGRKKVTDTIDPAAGLEVNCFIGQKVEKNQPLFYLYANQEELFLEAENYLKKAVFLSQDPCQSPTLISKIIDQEGEHEFHS